MRKAHGIVAALIFGVIACVAIKAMAINFLTKENFGTQQYYSLRTSAASSATVTGFLVSWDVSAVGGSADITISHSTGTGSGFTLNYSSTIYLLSGQTVKDAPGGIMINPTINVARLDAGTTVYIDMSYLGPRAFSY